MEPEVASSKSGNGDSDSQTQASEGDSNCDCERSEAPVMDLTWRDASSSDDFCSLTFEVLINTSLALDLPSGRGGSRKTGTLPAFSAKILAAPIRSLVSHD